MMQLLLLLLLLFCRWGNFYLFIANILKYPSCCLIPPVPQYIYICTYDVNHLLSLIVAYLLFINSTTNLVDFYSISLKVLGMYSGVSCLLFYIIITNIKQLLSCFHSLLQSNICIDYYCIYWKKIVSTEKKNLLCFIMHFYIYHIEICLNKTCI